MVLHFKLFTLTTKVQEKSKVDKIDVVDFCHAEVVERVENLWTLPECSCGCVD